MYTITKHSTGEKEPFAAMERGVFVPFNRIKITSNNNSFLFSINAASTEELISQRNNRVIPTPSGVSADHLRTHKWSSYTLISPPIADTATGKNVETVDLNALAKAGGGIVYVTCHNRAAVYTIEVDKEGQVLVFHFTPLETRDYDKGTEAKPFYSSLSANPFRRTEYGPNPQVIKLNGILKVKGGVAWPYFDGRPGEDWNDQIQSITILHLKTN